MDRLCLQSPNPHSAQLCTYAFNHSPSSTPMAPITPPPFSTPTSPFITPPPKQLCSIPGTCTASLCGAGDTGFTVSREGGAGLDTMPPIMYGNVCGHAHSSAEHSRSGMPNKKGNSWQVGNPRQGTPCLQVAPALDAVTVWLRIFHPDDFFLSTFADYSHRAVHSLNFSQFSRN